MKITVLGGGGFRTPMIHAGLLRRQGTLPVDELCLHDLNPGRLARIAAVLRAQALEAEAEIPVRTTSDLAPALEGADLVLCAIRVGGAAQRAADERAVFDVGLLGQETVGAAGILFALRTIPVMQQIAAEIERRAPRAWLLNFTNPAGVVTEALTPRLGGRVIGICDSPTGLVERVAAALGRDPRALRVGYAGLNHFGWLRSARDSPADGPTPGEGDDLLPGLLADDARLATLEEGRLFGGGWLRTLAMLPNEYLFYYDRTGAAMAEIRRLGVTRGEALLAGQDTFYGGSDSDPGRALRAWREARGGRERTYLQEAGAGVHTAPVGGDAGGYAEVALDVAEALRGGPPRRAILNVRNQGSLPGLDAEAVVEVPCQVTVEGAEPIPQPPLPETAGARVALLKAIDRLVLAAARGDRRALREAFGTHPLCGGADLAPRLVELATPVRADA